MESADTASKNGLVVMLDALGTRNLDIAGGRAFIDKVNEVVTESDD